MPTPTHTAPATSHFRELNTAELAAIEGLRKKSIERFRGPIEPVDLSVTYRFQRDGFCVCIIRGQYRKVRRDTKPPLIVLWTGVSKRSPIDPHNEIRGKMLAFVRAVQSTPATW